MTAKTKDKKILLILDCNAIIHRSFHALPDLRTSRGELVNAAYGFVSVLLKVLREFRPYYVLATFDVPGPTFRDEEFEDYKAKRQKAPDELYAQIPMIKEILEGFNIPVYEKEGFEADDVIGTASEIVLEKYSADNVDTIIVSGDLDTLQLVNKNTRVYTMRKGLLDTVLYDEEAVKNRFGGLAPSQMADFKGLRGDPSDNIPGVLGVGEKTAIHLLQKFGSLESLYKNLSENTNLANELKPKLKEKLVEFKDQAFFSRELATIRTDVPIDFTLKSFPWERADMANIQKLFNKFEFRTLFSRLKEVLSDTGREKTGRQTQNLPSAINKPKPPNDKRSSDEIYKKINQLYEDGVFSKEVKLLEEQLVPVIIEMEEAGIKIDKRYFRQLEKEASNDISKVCGRIYELAGRVFNINSSQQLSQVLFNELNISTKGLKKTPGGVISTAAPELEKLEGAHPLVEHLLKHRGLQKLYSTYIKPLPGTADKNDRIHTHFDSLGTATGRISSSNPNLQNIPVKGEWGLKIRRGFTPERGFRFLSFDYSQIELRIAAHISGDSKMIELFKNQGDVHVMTASEVFGVSYKDVTSEMRYKAKALNFGILYGMGSAGFAKSADISREEAQLFIENYFVRFPEIKNYIENTKRFANKNKYTETLMGRKRYVPEILSSHAGLRAQAERMAINHPIQGTGADIIKAAMVKIHNDPLVQKGGCRILLQIHDELLFECMTGIIKESVLRIKNVMENIFNMETPLVVDVKQGENWGDLEKVIHPNDANF